MPMDDVVTHNTYMSNRGMPALHVTVLFPKSNSSNAVGASAGRMSKPEHRQSLRPSRSKELGRGTLIAKYYRKQDLMLYLNTHRWNRITCQSIQPA